MISLFRFNRPLKLNQAINVTLFTGGVVAFGLLASGIGIIEFTSIPTGIAQVVLAFLLGLTLLLIYRQRRALKLKEGRIEVIEREVQALTAATESHLQVCEIDAQGKIASVNQSFADRFGYSASELVGKPISIIYVGGTSNRAYRALQTSLSESTCWAGESEDVTADGHGLLSRCTVTPVLDLAQCLVRAIVVRTDNKDAPNSDKSRFLKNLFDYLHDEIYVYDTESLGMVFANLSALKASGWSNDQLDQKSIVDADPHMDESLFRAHVAPLFSGEKDVVVTVVERGTKFGEITTRLAVGENGETLFVSVLRDATERKKIERAKAEAVSVVSHEMRTPLTSIKGSLRLLHSGTLGIFDNNAKQALDIAVRNTEQLLLLVDDILDLEKIRAGKMKMDKAPVDLVALVDEVVEMNRGYGDELRVNFQFETDLTDAIASVSAARFTQVLANLLSNAAKFTPAGETVQVMLDSENGFWKISVTDKGPGIPEEAYHMVFASFAQLRSPDGKERKGTGLGLAIAQRIVHAHDGEIDFVSKCGEGTTFFVKLPMHTIQPQQLDHAFKIEGTLENLNNPEKILLDDAKPLEI